MTQSRHSDDRPLTLQDLSEILLFRGEQPEALEWLLDHATVQTLPAGELLLSPERPNHTLYLVLEGRVQVRLDWQGHEAFAYLEAGHCVGEMSIIERTQPSAIVVTDTSCRLLLLDGAILWSLVDRSHAVARNLLYILSSRVRKDNLRIMESIQQHRISERNSKVDALTGLHNRRWLDETLEPLLRRSAMNNQPMSLLMLDLDHFKRFNDTYGHLAGDRALKTIADAILEQIRPTDAAARYGGEEFVVILPNTAAGDARAIAERLRTAVHNQPIAHTGEQPLPNVTVSIGLATSNLDLNHHTLLATADEALYRAKQAGRDRVSV